MAETPIRTPIELLNSVVDLQHALRRWHDGAMWTLRTDQSEAFCVILGRFDRLRYDIGALGADASREVGRHG